MRTTEADQLHRTVKLEMDENRARSPEEALRLARGYVLEIIVGAGIGRSLVQQAMLLTAINSGRRAFLGGVRVITEDNPLLTAGWANGVSLHEAITRYGGAVVTEGRGEHPTLVVGEPKSQPRGSITLWATCDGWSGGAVQEYRDRLPERSDFALAGVLAGALAVSEAFQHIRGNPVAGRRDVGLSLWRPGHNWREPECFGPACLFLPSKLWLLGLGHLGQAYCWSLGFLPYADRRQVMIYLQDFDVVVAANESTGLLVEQGMVGKTKTRVVAGRLESMGFQTRITERAFGSHTRRTAEEPSLALAGFDDPAPRQELEGANFGVVIDAGLGAGPEHYNDIVLHTFPSGMQAKSAFVSRPRASRRINQAAYEKLIKRRVEAGQSEGEAECGVLEIAGRTVGAAFVGAVAGTLVIAESLRMLCQGPRYQIVDLSLRSPQYRVAVENERPGPHANTGFARALPAVARP